MFNSRFEGHEIILGSFPCIMLKFANLLERRQQWQAVFLYDLRTIQMIRYCLALEVGYGPVTKERGVL